MMRKTLFTIATLGLMTVPAHAQQVPHCDAVLAATSQQRNAMLDNATRLGVELSVAKDQIAALQKKVAELTKRLNKAPSGGK